MNVSFEELVGLLGAANVKMFALEKELITAREQIQSLVNTVNELKNPKLHKKVENGRLEQSN
jgi:hypothetical protein